MARFNIANYLVHRHDVLGGGAEVAVRSGTQTLTYSELSTLVREVAAGLRLLGARPDDRVLLVASDGVPAMATILGAFHAGMVAVPISTMLTSRELGGIIRDSGARTVLCTPEHADTVAESLTIAGAIDQVVHVGSPGALGEGSAALVDWDQLLASGREAIAADDIALNAHDTDEDNWALWLYTSGTTGQPKAAMHRHANIRHVCESYGSRVLGITSEDVTLSVAKLFFAYGIGNSVFFPLSAGATSVLEAKRPTPDVALDRLRADRPTLFFGVPTFYASLLGSDLPDDAFASVRWCISAGEPLPAPLQRRFTERFGVEILDGIGSTEALHIFLSNRPGDIRPGTTGRPVPGYDVEVRDEDGHVTPPGRPGALFVRGDSIGLGYWRRVEASREVFRGAWLSTGDTYVTDDDGYFRCLGRSTDMLKAGGIWVSPTEVESRLLEHASVQQAAVVGATDDDGLDKPVAVVVADGVTEDELITWCRDGLAHFKAPRHVVFTKDLPRTPTGKLQRFRVRELLVPAHPDAPKGITSGGAP
ncbi:benzoate-CoA ligase family protein [Nocardioides sp. 1609]|uniref:benzoate-CoA ligase family protein n=1 Tax=Nocardioides sp. 1609 TaxID=2508327 RepID=UPI00106F430C|nr:benzoate-CoA ligase family protein [Nocardioides sp. 1609]